MTTEAIPRDPAAEAKRYIQQYQLEQVLQDRYEKLGDWLDLRRQHMEATRLVKARRADVDLVELDALAELEADPGHVPGKNAEARKDQRNAWLAAHRGVRQARANLDAAEGSAGRLALEVDAMEEGLEQYRLIFEARCTELNLIAAFIGGA